MNLVKNKTAIVYTCTHSDPRVSNKRFDLLGSLIYDVRPDYCVDLGDGADMRSLNSYDTRNPKALSEGSYQEDIDIYNDAQERIRWKFRHAKKRLPLFFGFEGNHEHRIKKVVTENPRLKGTEHGISFGHLQTNHWFSEYHEYENSGPSQFNYDGVLYSHFISGRKPTIAMAGKHHACSIVTKLGHSVTVGHSHKYSYFYNADNYPKATIGHVVGCFKGSEENWAGQANREWRKGVLIKYFTDYGVYDHKWVSMSLLEKVYG